MLQKGYIGYKAMIFDPVMLFWQEVADTRNDAQPASARADAPENMASETSARVDAPDTHAAMPSPRVRPPSDANQALGLAAPAKGEAADTQDQASKATDAAVPQHAETKAAKKKRKSKNKIARNKARQQRQAEEEEGVLGVQATEEEGAEGVQHLRQAEEEEEEVLGVQAKQEEAGGLQQHKQYGLEWHDAEVHAATCLRTTSSSACYNWGVHSNHLTSRCICTEIS